VLLEFCPAIFQFDIRYIVLLQSVEPLRVFVYNRFWLRFANLAFDLTDLDVYEKESRENCPSRHRDRPFLRRF
jgi:hypothetical protein